MDICRINDKSNISLLAIFFLLIFPVQVLVYGCMGTFMGEFTIHHASQAGLYFYCIKIDKLYFIYKYMYLQM